MEDHDTHKFKINSAIPFGSFMREERWYVNTNYSKPMINAFKSRILIQTSFIKLLLNNSIMRKTKQFIKIWHVYVTGAVTWYVSKR